MGANIAGSWLFSDDCLVRPLLAGVRDINVVMSAVIIAADNGEFGFYNKIYATFSLQFDGKFIVP
jgi:hypothetical protein